MRLDLYITEKGLSKSRTEAKALITEGAVKVNGETVKKPSLEILGTESVEVVVDEERYVSRGGLKLDGALTHFNIVVTGLSCIDVGASSGGFTDCLLRRGAARVLAVDSGQGQLVQSLLSDPRVISYEKFNAKLMTPEMLPFTPDFAVMDVSFISAKLIIPAVYACLNENGGYVLLIKPQFEVGRAGVGKGGIVKDKRMRDMAVREVIEFAEKIGFYTVGLIESPIKGGDGNTEYLAYFRKGVTI